MYPEHDGYLALAHSSLMCLVHRCPPRLGFPIALACSCAFVSGWDDLAAQLKADIAADVASARQQAPTASRVRGEVEAARGQAETDGVCVEVDVSGRLVALKLNDSALNLGAEQLADTILATAVTAQREAAKRVVGIAEREFGEDAEFTARIRTEIEGRLPPQPEPERPPTPAPGPLAGFFPPSAGVR